MVSSVFKTSLFLGVLLCYGLTGYATSLYAADPAEGRSLSWRSLKIRGVKYVPLQDLKEQFTMPLPSPWPWKKPPPFRTEDLERDLELLQHEFRRHGFYHARIDPEVHINEAGQVDVTLHVTMGSWVKVTKIEVAWDQPVPPLDLRSLEEAKPLKVGSRFTEKHYDALKRLFLNYLLNHGYPQARVEGKVLLDEEADTAEIFITLRPGRLAYFGEPQIKGELETPDYLIRRRLTFQGGEVFSFDELYNSQRRLYETDLFQSVNLTPEVAREEDHRIPVVVELQEKKKRSVRVGLGYGDEDEFRARLGLRFRNLAGGGRLLDLETKYSRLETKVAGTFTNPQLWATRNDAVLLGGFVRRYLPGFTDKAYYSQARLERDLPWRLRGYVGYGLEFARPFNIPLQTLLLLKETESGRLYTASMAMVGLRRDSTDHPIYPRRGGLLSVSAELAPDFLGSSLQFARTMFEARRYQAVGRSDLIMAARVKLGLIEPIQATADIPIYRRFFCGGYGSVRGYRLDYLGPRTSAGDPIGGEALLEGNLEARLPLYKDLHALAFLDFGNVFLKMRHLDVGQLKYASGFGLRYHTPFGPLGVDVGFPLNPIDPRRDDYHVHFTIGQTF